MLTQSQELIVDLLMLQEASQGDGNRSENLNREDLSIHITLAQVECQLNEVLT